MLKYIIHMFALHNCTLQFLADVAEWSRELNISGAGTAYPSGAPEFTPAFSGVHVTRSLVLCVCFVDHCLSFCTLCCLFFFDLRILITPLVSSNYCKAKIHPAIIKQRKVFLYLYTRKSWSPGILILASAEDMHRAETCVNLY